MTRITLRWKDQPPQSATPGYTPGEGGGMLVGHVDAVVAALSASPVYCNSAAGLCSRQWGDLIATSHPKTRYCEHCSNEVHRVNTYKQLTALRHSGLCVAYTGQRPLAGKVVP